MVGLLMSYVPNTEAQRHHLRENYGYHCDDRSLVAKHIMQPFWRRAVNWLPLWLAPNLVTLIGFAFMITAYCSVVFYLPNVQMRDGEREPPRLLWLWVAFCTFMYQTLDALDGKQARRTGSSSPLGELFDHGCDAVTTTLLAGMVATALQLTPPQAFVLLMTILIAFYLAQWEEYHTGTMYLGPLNVTEAQFLCMGQFITTFVNGPAWWQRTKLTVPLVGTLSLAEACLVFGVSVTTMTCLVYVATVLQKCRGAKLLSALELLAPVASAAFYAIYWAVNSPVRVLYTDAHRFSVAVGLTFAFFVGKIVLARVCNQAYQWFQLVTWPLALGAVNAYAGNVILDERRYVGFFLTFAVLAYLDFALSVIRDLTTLLDINCLTLTDAQMAALASSTIASKTPSKSRSKTVTSTANGNVTQRKKRGASKSPARGARSARSKSPSRRGR